MLDAEIEALQAMLDPLTNPEISPYQREQAQARLEGLVRQRDFLRAVRLGQGLGPNMLQYYEELGPAAPPTEEVIEARPGFLERATDRVTEFFGG